MFAQAVILAMLVWGMPVFAGEDTEKSSAQPPKAAAVQEVASETQDHPAGEAKPKELSPAVVAVVKMAAANVSPEVIKTYVEATPSTVPVKEADIIALKEHKVSDEIVTLLIKQGAKGRALAEERKKEAVNRALAARNSRYSGLDPESYSYFQHYYLEPRAVGSAYDRVTPYYYSRGPYGYGHRPGYGFRSYGRPW